MPLYLLMSIYEFRCAPLSKPSRHIPVFLLHLANKSGGLMAHCLTLDDAWRGVIRVHTFQKNEKVYNTGSTDVKMIPASVRGKAGRHTSRRWQAECVKAAVCV